MDKIVKVLFSMLAVFLMITVSSVAYARNTQTIENNQVSTSDIIALGPHIVIPDDFSTIQEAINKAEPGNTIFVRSGVYKENINISTDNLFLFGENKITTIIDGCNNGDVIDIFADGIKISGFTIKNGTGKPVEWFRAGILVSKNCANCTITDNIFSNNTLGLYCTQAINITISNNKFYYDGLTFGLPDNMDIKYYLHNISNNTVNGKPLYYYVNNHDFKVPEDAGQIISVSCTNMTVENVYLTHTDFEINLVFCSNCIIKNTSLSSNDGELWLVQSSNNTIQGNNISKGLHGICIQQESNNNTIKNNYLLENIWAGVSVLEYCSGNIIEDNLIEKTQKAGGIYIRSSYGNIVHDNILIKSRCHGFLLQNSSNNSIFRNNITRTRLCGIKLEESSNNNTIENNNLRFNLLHAFFKNSFQNRWNGNYWGRPKMLPKLIFGIKKAGLIPTPAINFDLKPAKLPN